MSSAIILCVFTLFLVSGSDGFLASVIGHGGQSDNCVNWSNFTDCDCSSTSDRGFFDKLPEQCYRNPNLALMLGIGRGILNKFYDYAESVNSSANACGMCNIRISCSPFCDKNKPGGNHWGVADKVCTELPTERQACAINSRKTYNNATKTCQVWPPLNRKQSEFLPPIVPKPWRDQAWKMKPVNCVSVGERCYCCCQPYFPNPCDATCVLKPCHNGLSFTVDEVITLITLSRGNQ